MLLIMVCFLKLMRTTSSDSIFNKQMTCFSIAGWISKRELFFVKSLKITCIVVTSNKGVCGNSEIKGFLKNRCGRTRYSV